jgi:hypothetical protein
MREGRVPEEVKDDAMNRKVFFGKVFFRCGGLAICLSLAAAGCRGHQYGHVLKDNQEDMVGSHTAGAETFNPLIQEAVARLLSNQGQMMQQVSMSPNVAPPGPQRICFVGVENKSAEEIGDFKEQIYQEIDTQILQCGSYQAVSRRFVDAGLRETRLRPDSLFVPENMRTFSGVMEQMGQPFDFLLYATITSGTTQNNDSYQRDYLLTLEMVNIHNGQYSKDSAKVRKGYHHSKLGAIKNYSPF